MIHAYIGDGKGKTTASIGLLVRACGAGKKVAMIAFDKGSKTYEHSELMAFDKLGIEHHITGLERMEPSGRFRFENLPEDLAEAKRGLEKALELAARGDLDLLVLDEILSAVTYKLLEGHLLMDFLMTVPKNLELVLTGRCDDEIILAKADLVTEMKKVRHYFDKGVQARKGIEF
jgi:cob(I)alamin adenosyltransferase